MSDDIKARVERARELSQCIRHWVPVTMLEVAEQLDALAADCERLQGECDREKERADRAEKELADRRKTLAGFQLELDSKKEREESLREQLATAQRERDDLQRRLTRFEHEAEERLNVERRRATQAEGSACAAMDARLASLDDAQRARDTAAKLNRRAQQLESELAAHRNTGTHSALVQQNRALRRDLDQAKDHVRILSRYQRALEKGVSTDPADGARVHQILQQEADEQQRELVACKAKAARAEQSLAETVQLMVLAKDAARNAAPILRLHKQLVAAAKANDDQAVNRIVAELALVESPL